MVQNTEQMELEKKGKKFKVNQQLIYQQSPLKIKQQLD